MNYRSSILDKSIDELKILQYNQIIYKGCLQDGGQFQIRSLLSINFSLIFSESFTFKSRRDSNQSTYKLDVYRNDLFDEEIISCCEYGLVGDNQHDLFQVEQIIGFKPCQK